MQNKMSIYRGINPIQIGSRKYGIYDEDSDYDFVLLVPQSRVRAILDAWSDAEISEYKNPFRYRIAGFAAKGSGRAIPGVPVDATYDITLVPKPDNMPDDRFLTENWRIYWMIHITDIDDEIRPEMIARLTQIRKWAKDNKVYGGAYPGGVSYLIYARNTILKGYTRNLAFKMLYKKCLYYHPEYQYTHVSHMSDKNFEYMRKLLTGESLSGEAYPFIYTITSPTLDNAVRNARYLLDKVEDAYIMNDGIIRSKRDIRSVVDTWIDELRSYNIAATVS